MIKIGQFTTNENSSLLLASKIAIHLRNQKYEKITSLQKRYCSSNKGSNSTVLIESLIILFSLGKITYNPIDDSVSYNENK